MRTTPDGAQAVTLAAQHLPDVAFVDVQMPVMNGIEATRRIVADPLLSELKVVILTNYAKTHVNRAMAKLHARDRAQLVVWAYESGLVAARRAGEIRRPD